MAAAGVLLFRRQAQRLVDAAWATRAGRHAPEAHDQAALELARLRPECARAAARAAGPAPAAPLPVEGWEEDDREAQPSVWRSLLLEASAGALRDVPVGVREALLAGAASRRPPRALCPWVLSELCRQCLASLVPPERWDGAAIALAESKTIGDAAMQKPCPHDPARRSKRAYGAAQRLSLAGRGTSDLCFALRPPSAVCGLPLEEPWSRKARQREARALLAAPLEGWAAQSDEAREALLEELAEPLEAAATRLAATVGCGQKEARLYAAAWGAACLRSTRRALRALLELLNAGQGAGEPAFHPRQEVLVRCATLWRAARRAEDGLVDLVLGAPPSHCAAVEGRPLRLLLEDCAGPDAWLDAQVVRATPEGLVVRCDAGARALAGGGPRRAWTRTLQEERAVVIRADHVGGRGRLEVRTRSGARWRSAGWGGAAFHVFSCRHASSALPPQLLTAEGEEGQRPLVQCGAAPDDRLLLPSGEVARALLPISGSLPGCRARGLGTPLRSSGGGALDDTAPVGRLCGCEAPCACPPALTWDEEGGTAPEKRRRRDESGGEGARWGDCALLVPPRGPALPPEAGWPERFVAQLPHVVWAGPCSHLWRRAARTSCGSCHEGGGVEEEEEEEEEGARGRRCACERGLADELRAALHLAAPAISARSLTRAVRAVEQELGCADAATLLKHMQLGEPFADLRAASWRRREQRLLARLRGDDGVAIVARRALLPLPPEAAALVDETKCRLRACNGVLLPATRQDRSADEEGTAILVCCVCGATELDTSAKS